VEAGEEGGDARDERGVAHLGGRQRGAVEELFYAAVGEEADDLLGRGRDEGVEGVGG